MAQVIKHAEVQFICRVRRLRDRSVVAPGTLIQQWIARRVMRIVLSDEKTAGDAQEVHMLTITWIQEMHRAVFDREATEEDGSRLGLAGITQQPGVIAFPRSGIGDVGKLYPQFIVDPLTAILIELATIQEEGLARPQGRRGSISLRQQQQGTETCTEQEGKSDDGCDDQRIAPAFPFERKWADRGERILWGGGRSCSFRWGSGATQVLGNSHVQR